MEFELGSIHSGYEFLQMGRTSAATQEYCVRNVLAERLETLKVLTATGAPASEAFLREARILARVSHPHIVTFYSAIPIDGHMVLTTEWREFEPLVNRLSNGPIPWLEAAQIARQILSALAALHERGIAHLDVTPNSVVFDGEHWKLAGFEQARLLNGAPIYGDGKVTGNLRYASPEQVKGIVMDQRTDIYAFGAVLYEMLCGRPPFDCKSQFELMLSHVNETPLPPGQRTPGLPASLDEIVLSALAKAPELRPSAVDFGARLSEIEAEERRRQLAPVIEPVETRQVIPAPPTETTSAVSQVESGGIAEPAISNTAATASRLSRLLAQIHPQALQEQTEDEPVTRSVEPERPAVPAPSANTNGKAAQVALLLAELHQFQKPKAEPGAEPAFATQPTAPLEAESPAFDQDAGRQDPAPALVVSQPLEAEPVMARVESVANLAPAPQPADDGELAPIIFVTTPLEVAPLPLPADDLVEPVPVLELVEEPESEAVSDPAVLAGLTSEVETAIEPDESGAPLPHHAESSVEPESPLAVEPERVLEPIPALEAVEPDESGAPPAILADSYIEPEPVLEPAPAPQEEASIELAPAPQLAVEPEPVLEPIPALEAEAAIELAAAPQIADELEPVLEPAPASEAEAAIELAAAPQLADQPAPVLEPIPAPEAEAAIELAAAPQLAVEPEPVLEPAPAPQEEAIELAAAQQVADELEPVLEPAPAPQEEAIELAAAPQIAAEPEPVLEPAPAPQEAAIELAPAPQLAVEPEPVLEPAPAPKEAAIEPAAAQQVADEPGSVPEPIPAPHLADQPEAVPATFACPPAESEPVPAQLADSLRAPEAASDLTPAIEIAEEVDADPPPVLEAPAEVEPLLFLAEAAPEPESVPLRSEPFEPAPAPEILAEPAPEQAEAASFIAEPPLNQADAEPAALTADATQAPGETPEQLLLLPDLIGSGNRPIPDPEASQLAAAAEPEPAAAAEPEPAAEPVPESRILLLPPLPEPPTVEVLPSLETALSTLTAAPSPNHADPTASKPRAVTHVVYQPISRGTHAEPHAGPIASPQSTSQFAPPFDPALRGDLLTAAEIVAKAAEVTTPPVFEPVFSATVPLTAHVPEPVAPVGTPVTIDVAPPPSVPTHIAAATQAPGTFHWVMLGGSVAALGVIWVAIYFALH